MKITKVFFNQTIVYMAGTVVVGIFGYAFNFGVSHYLSVIEYGILQSLFGILAVFGITGSAISYIAIQRSAIFASQKEYGRYHSFITWYRGRVRNFSAYLFFIILICSALLQVVIGGQMLLSGITIALSVVIMNEITVYIGALSGWKKFYDVTVINTSLAVVKLVTGIIVVTLLPQATPAVLAVVCTAILALPIAQYLHRRHIPRPERNDDAVAHQHDIPVREAVAVLAFSLAIAACSNIDIIVVRAFADSTLTGHYAALSLFTKMVVLMNLTITSTSLPSAFAASSTGALMMRNELIKGYSLICAISLFGVLGIHTLGSTIISHLMNPIYLQYSEDLWLFGILGGTLSLFMYEASLNYAHKKRGWQLVISLVLMSITLLIYIFHTSISSITLSMIFSTSVGFIALAILHVSHRLPRSPKSME